MTAAGGGRSLRLAPDLPVHAVLPALRAALHERHAAVLTAPPGSGKTTVVPLALLDEPWLLGQAILVSEPRRLAARAAAARMAELVGEAVGETVGYRVRFDQRVSARTRIEVMTEGVLVRRLQGDPGLAGVGLVVLDEIHERSLLGDLALALTLDARAGLRVDLRVLVMSATLEAEPVARVLGGAPVIAAAGRPHPVEVRYLERESARPLPERVAEGVRRGLASAAGDVLAFLPGAGEIRAAAERLSDLGEVEVLPLHGDLPAEAQDRALRPAARGRRVVLATPIAETSLTLEGVRVVVDGGFARRPRFDPASGLTRLETVRVSRASADQRAGRAGRQGPGLCLRLWTAGTQHALIAQTPAEILEADLAPLALELALWGVTDAAALAWCDRPPAGALAQGRALLEALGALDRNGRITALGRRLAGLPFHPRLGRMLLAAAERGLAGVGCDLAALLSERDVLRGERGRAGADLADRLAALEAWRSRGDAGARHWGADPVACARVDRAARQAREALGAKGRGGPSGPGTSPVGELLASAYPDRIGQRQAGVPGRFRLASGRGVRLPETDPLAAREYLVAAHLDAGSSGDGRVFLAAALDRDALARATAGMLARVEVVDWDPQARAVLAREEDRLGALVLAARPLAAADPERLRETLLRGLRQAGPEVLPWTPGARELQARVLSLRSWRPREGWPDVSDGALMDHLADWLGPYLTGMTRAEHLARIDLAAVLGDRLGWERVRRLDEAAPTHLPVPSGARRRLVYQPGEPPILAVKLQELFGLAETPRVCWGEVAVQLHLLSPAGRPLQVTQDLRGFWERTYPEVRKELRGRYPKHPWPEDPWSARPTAGPKRHPGR